MIRVTLLVFLLMGCTSRPTQVTGPFERAPYDALLSLPPIEAILAIDEVSEAPVPESAAWFWLIQNDQAADVALRTRAASALAELGYRSGNAFCIAVLGANLEAFSASDAEHGLPRYDRWAFAREIALAHLRGQLLDRGKAVPDYDVNYGAPQMTAAARAFEQAIAALRMANPDASVRERIESIPKEAPNGRDQALWDQARAACLEALKTDA